jgi:hypothetical protein
MAEFKIQTLRTRVEDFLEPAISRPSPDVLHEAAVEVLTRTVRKGWRTYLVGGFLRDAVVNPNSLWPRDFDVVVDGCSSEELRNVFVDIVVGHNRFGGLALRQAVHGSRRQTVQQLQFDVWRLQDTWAVREFALPHSIDAFVHTPFLNIDSIAISIGPGDDYLNIFEHGFFHAIETCVVEINEPTNPFPVLCAIRGLTIASTLNFVIGPQLAKFVYELATKVSLEEFVTAQLAHYHQMKSSRDQIDQWIVDVRTQLEAGQDRVRLNPSAVEREL